MKKIKQIINHLLDNFLAYLFLYISVYSFWVKNDTTQTSIALVMLSVVLTHKRIDQLKNKIDRLEQGRNK